MPAIPSAGDTPGMPCIYELRCRVIKRSYIGQTTNLARRFLEHQVQLKRRKHPNRFIQRVYDRYGPQSFDVRVLERLSLPYDEMLYSYAERRWVEQFKGRLLNVRPPGTDKFLRLCPPNKATKRG